MKSNGPRAVRVAIEADDSLKNPAARATRGKPMAARQTAPPPEDAKGGDMQKALVKLGVILFSIGILLISCATNAAKDTPEAMAAPESTAERPAAAVMSAEEQEARRQYEIERNRFIYEDIFFAKNKYRLDDQARERLDWKAQWLRQHAEVNVVIEGHCGAGGNTENNMALGLRRAGEVKGYLLHKGVARDRLTAISYGSERPVASGEGEEIQAKNRRVRLTIAEE